MPNHEGHEAIVRIRDHRKTRISLVAESTINELKRTRMGNAHDGLMAQGVSQGGAERRHLAAQEPPGSVLGNPKPFDLANRKSLIEHAAEGFSKRIGAG